MLRYNANFIFFSLRLGRFDYIVTIYISTNWNRLTKVVVLPSKVKVMGECWNYISIYTQSVLQVAPQSQLSTGSTGDPSFHLDLTRDFSFPQTQMDRNEERMDQLQ